MAEIRQGYLDDFTQNTSGNIGIGTTSASDAKLEIVGGTTTQELNITGIATDTGGRTSHAVIMARASGVPAVVGLRGLTERLSEGDTILIDGFEGLAIINPGQTTLFRYGKVDLQRKKLKDLLVYYKD